MDKQRKSIEQMKSFVVRIDIGEKESALMCMAPAETWLNS